MSRLLRSEMVKLSSVTSNRVLLLLIVALGIGFGVFVCLVVPASDLRNAGQFDTNTSFSLALAGAPVAASLVAVLGIQLIAQDLRFTARLTFAAEPRRTLVMVAKAIAITVLGLVAGALMVVVTLAVCGPILRIRDFPFDTGTPGFWRAAVGTVLLTMLYGIYGLGLAAIVRSAVAAIPILIVWALVVESALYGLLPHVGQYAPFKSATQIAMIEPANPGLSPVAGYLWSSALALSLLVLGIAVTNRRDV